MFMSGVGNYRQIGLKKWRRKSRGTSQCIVALAPDCVGSANSQRKGSRVTRSTSHFSQRRVEVVNGTAVHFTNQKEHKSTKTNLFPHQN